MWTVSQQCRRAIELPHLEFTRPGGVNRSCSDSVDAPIATGRSLSAVSECYTSQLTIMVTPDLNGTSVSCEHDNGTNVECIDIYSIILTSGKDIKPTLIFDGVVTFSFIY